MSTGPISPSRLALARRLLAISDRIDLRSAQAAAAVVDAAERGHLCCPLADIWIVAATAAEEGLEDPLAERAISGAAW
jgi:hypothetical protein